MFDIEKLLIAFIPAMKANLATQITAINAEKGDYPLDLINDQGWIVQSMNDKSKSFKNFCFIGVGDVFTTVNGNGVTETVSIEIDIFMAMTNAGFDSVGIAIDEKKLFRYWRALKQAAQKTWDKVGVGYDRAEVSSLTPIDIKLNDSPYAHKLCGVLVSFSINN